MPAFTVFSVFRQALFGHNNAVISSSFNAVVLIHLVFLSSLSQFVVFVHCFEFRSFSPGCLSVVCGRSCCAQGNLCLSCDADGVVKVWDLRTVTELRSIATGLSLGSLELSYSRVCPVSCSYCFPVLLPLLRAQPSSGT